MVEKFKKKKRKVKRKQSNFKDLKEHALKGCAAAIQKGAAVTGLPRDLLIKAVKKIWRLPRPILIISAYILTLLVAGGIFFWRIDQMQTINHPDLEPPFNWDHYSNEEHPARSDNERVEDPDEDRESVEAIIPGETIPATAPPFSRGVWPLKGEIHYEYGDLIERHSGVYRYARGLAVEANSGTEVKSAWGGTVIKKNYIDIPYGSSITIRHSNGFIAFYGALSEVAVSKGDNVRQGQVIGKVAASVGADHPDYMLMKLFADRDSFDNDKPVNPRDYLKH